VSLMRSGLNNEGIRLLEKMADDLVSHYKKYRRADFYVSKEMAIHFINEYYLTLTSRKLESKKIKTLLDELKKGSD